MYESVQMRMCVCVGKLVSMSVVVSMHRKSEDNLKE